MDKKAMDYSDNYINIKDASEYLGVTKGTLHNWMANPQNGVPCHKIGRAWKFKKRELDEWVNSGRAADVK